MVCAITVVVGGEDGVNSANLVRKHITTLLDADMAGVFYHLRCQPVAQGSRGSKFNGRCAAAAAAQSKSPMKPRQDGKLCFRPRYILLK